MKVLTRVLFASQPFTWDHTDPFYSTNGHFDPAKLKEGVGSMVIAMIVQHTDLIPGSLKHTGPIVDESTVNVFIVGPGE